MKKFTHYRQSIPGDAKRIPSLPGYYATPDGSILTKSKRGMQWANENTKIKVIELSDNSISNSGYKMVQPYKDGKKLMKYVHTLVAEAFLGPRPEGLEIDHINRDKWDNSASNLRYTTHTQNMNNKSNTISEDIKQKVAELREQGLTYQVIADKLNISLSSSWKIMRS